MARLLDALGQLCDDLGDGQHKPNARWIRDLLFGALTSRSLQLSEVARALDEDARDGGPRRLIHVHKRLSRGLNSDRLDDEALEHQHLDRAGRTLRADNGRGAVIALDGSMLVKPRSRTDDRGQEMCVHAWDNARGEITTGYPMVAISGVDAQGRRCPLLLRPYSPQEDGYQDRTETHLDALRDVAGYIGQEAVVVVDRNYSGRRTFLGMDDLGFRWVCREKIGGKSRRVMTRTGEVLPVAELVNKTLPTMRTEKVEGRGRKRWVRVIDIARRKIKIVGADGQPEGPWRTLIACWSDYANPLVLITSDWRRSKDEVLEAVNAWGKRWNVERVIQGAKARRWGLELNSLRARTLRGVKRLCLLAVALLALVERLSEREDIVRRCLSGFASFDHVRDPDNLTQRLLRAASGLLGRVRRGDLLAWHDEVSGRHRPQARARARASLLR